ncbi:MAG: tyrosine-type recombinase/integrase [Dehalococcoidia bacterium]|jgi:integrase|nr:tyrosine-type recombinase/integrase [Dehalococcoidia bacterium]
MARRGNNEGSIYKRADGRWAAVVSLGWQDGGRKRKTFYGRTRREVQEQLTIALRAHLQGLPVASERLSLGRFLDSWLVDSVKATVRPRTLQSYTELVRIHLGPGLGRIPLSKLTPQDVQRLINRKLAAGLSPRRVQYIHAVLRRALSQAEKWGLVARNVAKLVNAPRVVQAEIDPFTPGEARAFIQAIRGERLEALYALAITTGMRQAELLGLFWSDVDLDKRELAIRTTLQRINGEFQFLEPKTARSHRILALPDMVVESLRAHKGRQIGEKLQVGPDWEELDLVFTAPNGGPLSDRVVRTRFYRILEAAGLRRQRFHDLRHSCASLMIAQGVQSREVMETLGHSTIVMTLNRYGHIFPNARRETAEKMGQILSG